MELAASLGEAAAHELLSNGGKSIRYRNIMRDRQFYHIIYSLHCLLNGFRGFRIPSTVQVIPFTEILPRTDEKN